MTEQNLSELLVAERDWRIHELELCKKIPFLYTYPSFRTKFPIFWKFCVPIIYSHWEGFCVAAMKMLVDYLNEKDISYKDAANHILLLDNRKRFGYLQGNCTREQQTKFLSEFLEAQSQGISIDRSIISANSNLNYKQLSIMLSSFEISVSNKLEQQKPTIEKLVWFRNSIAHGDNSITVTQIDIENFINSITKCIDELIALFLEYILKSNYYKHDRM